MSGRASLVLLARFWSHRRVAEVSNFSKVRRGTVEAYVAWRVGQPVARRGTGGGGWMVFEGGAVGDAGLLHRLGPDTAPGPMAGVPVQLPRRILAHLERWRRLDAAESAATGRSLDHVLHFSECDRLLHPPYAAFNAARREACLPEDVVLGDLAYTCGVWIMQAGRGRQLPACRQPKEPPNPTLRAGAFLCGMSFLAFRKLYKSDAKGSMAGQHRALEVPPASVA